MNKVFLLGKLTSGPIFKTTTNGITFAEITLEVDESFIKNNQINEKKAIHSVLAWDNLSPIVSKLNTNDTILIEGTLVTKTIVNNKTGGHFKNCSVNANKIIIITNTPIKKVEEKKDEYDFPTDGDIPF